ncbi:hypothetical protein [Flavobacterium caeni]|uniref:Predicted 3-hydroxylacyl-ACP dehydratase, HotDog domain n=1 Tax=Flavobacterium caeni TaxID=490189 RepID=A0A1G5H5E3_9FLAO|nr:hypothetical protein [Flavobacterium caeni]SCY58897.1 Predicted 3-hydroxylacyl-ACP dehydratase, HotDog domain [Flavobacterium caeni]
MTALFEKDFVEDLLPQKFPFVMVDKMYAYTETTIVTGFEVKSDNIFCADGLFREPGLVEHMAQSVAMHTGYQFYLKQETAPTGYIGSISGIEIKKLPKLGQNIQTTVQILQEFGGITMVDITTTLEGETIASGQMKTVLAK